MPDPILLLVVALAVARLTGLVVTDTITEPIREAVLERLDDREATLGAFVSTLITCPWCASIWISAVAAPVVFLAGEEAWVVIPALLLAFSQVAGMVSSVGR